MTSSENTPERRLWCAVLGTYSADAEAICSKLRRSLAKHEGDFDESEVAHDEASADARALLALCRTSWTGRICQMVDVDHGRLVEAIQAKFEKAGIKCQS